MRFLSTLWNFFADLLYTTWQGVGHLTNIAMPRAIQYLQILLVLGLIMAIVPAIPALIGLIGGWRWLVAAAGLLWGFLALLLFIFAAPLGILINSLLGAIGLQTTNQRAGRRYVMYVGGALLFGMFFALMASIVPWRENPRGVPFLILAAAILAVGGTIWGSSGIIGRRFVIFTTSFIIVVLITSFFFPKTFSSIESARQKADEYIAKGLATKIVVGTNLPVCAETEKAHIVTNIHPRLEIPIWEECWSGWIDVQTAQKTNFRFYKKPEKGFLEVYFMDGSRRLIHENERIWFGHIPRLTFRLRGSEGTAVVEIESATP